MAGHSQFKNIMHRKSAQDNKRAKLFTKLIREIITSVRTGQPDPAFNSRLRSAIATARALNLPKDRIDNAVKRGSSASEGENYEEIRYEGYAPGGVAIIVEALTDNRNRTASEVRSAFTKMGGALGETGSVSFMFNRLGLIEYPLSIASNDAMFEAALEAGASSCESSDEIHEIFCEPDELSNVREILVAKYGEPEQCRLSWRGINNIMIDDVEKAQKIIKLVDLLEDSDDVQFVYGNYIFADSIMDKINL